MKKAYLSMTQKIRQYRKDRKCISKGTAAQEIVAASFKVDRADINRLLKYGVLLTESHLKKGRKPYLGR